MSTVKARRGPPILLEVAVYLLLALGAIAPAIGVADRLVGDGVDLYGTIWFYWWIADCMASFRDPSFTDLFFHPYGKDIFAHTGNNFVDAVIAAPLQWLLGNPGYYKWWVALVVFGNAWSFRLLARSLMRDGWAAFVASALWAVNPYLMFELTTGRPTQAFVWFLPLAFWGLLQAGRSWTAAVLGGVAAALTGWSYWFYGYFFAFAAVWIVAIETIGRLRRGEPVRRWLAGVGVAGAVALLLVLPAVVGMAGRAETGQVPGVTAGSRDLWALPDTLMNGVSPMLHGYFLHEPFGGRFLLHPAWLAILLAWGLLGRGRLRWGGVLAVALLLATGAGQPFGDEQVVMWHYVLLYNTLPFFDRLWFPYRALVLAFLAISLGLGLTLDRWLPWLRARWGEGRVRVATVGAGAALLAGTLAVERADHVYPLVIRDVPLPRAYTWMAEQGGGVIDLPRGITQMAIVHQTRHQLPMFGGMAENAKVFWPHGFEQSVKLPFVKALTRAARHPDRPVSTDADPALLRAQGFRWVVLHRELVDSEFNRYAAGIPRARLDAMPRLATERLSELLGAPVAVDGPMVVWSLDPVPDPPESLRPTPRTLQERIWERPQPTAYEARLHELGRLP